MNLKPIVLSSFFFAFTSQKLGRGFVVIENSIKKTSSNVPFLSLDDLLCINQPQLTGEPHENLWDFVPFYNQTIHCVDVVLQ